MIAPVQVKKTWYVYAQCDPDTELPFYIGKGTGDRIDYHELYPHSAGRGNPAKHKVIAQIHAKGKKVLKKKLAEFEEEEDAYIYEWAMICLYAEHLTNAHLRVGRITLSNEKQESMLTHTETAKLLSIAPKILRQLVAREEIKSYKHFYCRRYRRSDVEDYLEQRQHGSRDEDR